MRIRIEFSQQVNPIRTQEPRQEKMVGERRIERRQHAPKAWMRPLHHSPKLGEPKLERRARVERATRGFADRRLTDRLPSRTCATNLGPDSGIGPESHAYHACALPLS